MPRIPSWLDWSSGKRGAVARLPSGLLFREATDEPRYVWRWFLALGLTVIPLYYITWAVSDVGTWVAGVLLWAFMVWSLSVRVASAIVFPGGLSLTSRRFEKNIALQVKERVDELAKEVVFRSKLGDCAPNMLLPKHVADAAETFVHGITTSLAEHVKRSELGPKAESLIQCMQQFVSAVQAWKSDLKNEGLRMAAQASGEALLLETETMLDMREKPLRAKKKRGTRKRKSATVEPSDAETATVFEDDDDEEEGKAKAKETEDEDEEDDDDSDGFEDGLNAEDDENAMKDSDEGFGLGDGLLNKKDQSKWRWLWEAVAGQVEVFRAARKPFPGVVSYDWARTHLEQFHDGESRLLDSNAYRIDVCYFTARRPSTVNEGEQPPPYSSDQCVVMCNPNAARYEQYALHPFWLDFYRSRQMNVLVWNFRGYGRSEGSPSPQALRQDVETIVRFLLEEKRCKRILFHGESIGGIAACHAASVCGPQTLLIADRTFSSLDAVSRALAGSILATILFYATGWDADNITGFLASGQGSKRNRLVLQDPQDDIVRHRASLKIGCARRILDEMERSQSAHHRQRGDEENPPSAIQVRFTKRLCRDVVDSIEQMALAVSRPSYDARIEQVETSEGEKVSFNSFSSEAAFRGACDFVKVLLNLDGGHGQLLGKALVEELERRRERTQFAKSRLGKCLIKVRCANERRSIRELDAEDNYVFDWFASVLVFANDEVLREGPPAPAAPRLHHGGAGFAMTHGLQILRKIVEANGGFARDPESCAVHVNKIVTALESIVAMDRSALPDFRGALVPLKCGHNGAPGKADLLRIEQFMMDAGWNFQHYRAVEATFSASLDS